MLSSALVKVLLDKKEEKVITAKEAHDIYLEQQRTGGPAKLQIWTYSPVYNRFAFQYPTSFSRETSGRDLMVLTVNTEVLYPKKKNNLLDIPLFTASKVLVALGRQPSLLTVQAIQNFQTKQCQLGIMKNWGEIIYIPITKADRYSKGKEKEYNKPMSKVDMTTYDVYRITFRDAAATVTDFCVVV